MFLKQQIRTQLEKALKEFEIAIEPSIDYPVDREHGDYSTNIALIAAKKAGKNPIELAEKIVEKLSEKNKVSKMFIEIRVAKPGFINFWVTSDSLVASLTT